jgi:hypothetical protein
LRKTTVESRPLYLSISEVFFAAIRRTTTPLTHFKRLPDTRVLISCDPPSESTTA